MKFIEIDELSFVELKVVCLEKGFNALRKYGNDLYAEKTSVESDNQINQKNY